MDPAVKKRIDQAWKDSQEWVAEFDGTPNLTLLINVPVEWVAPGLAALAAQTENFRITSIAAGKPDAPQFIDLAALPEHLALLQEGKLAELSVNYAVRFEAFDLDIHTIIYPVKPEKVALELDWWSDQVFSAETENYAQFAALMEYFIGLQKLFNAPNLFISPESGKDPKEGEEYWVEV